MWFHHCNSLVRFALLTCFFPKKKTICQFNNVLDYLGRVGAQETSATPGEKQCHAVVWLRHAEVARYFYDLIILPVPAGCCSDVLRLATAPLSAIGRNFSIVKTAQSLNHGARLAGTARFLSTSFAVKGLSISIFGRHDNGSSRFNSTSLVIVLNLAAAAQRWIPLHLASRGRGGRVWLHKGEWSRSSWDDIDRLYR